jgi:peroxiredoxin
MNCKINLNYLLAIPLIFGLFFSACKSEVKTRIEGQLSGIKEPIEVTLLRQDFDKTVPLESAKLKNDKQKFVFKLKGLVEPTFFQLQISGGKSRTIILLAEPGEQIKLEIDLNHISSYKVSGSEGSEKTKILAAKIARTIKTLDSLTQQYNKTKNASQRELITEKYNETITAQRAFSTDFIWENTLSRASVMALYQQFGDNQYVFDRPEDLMLFKAVASSLRAFFPESDYTEGMLRDIANQEKILASHKLIQLVRDAEPNLPEISLPTPQGDTIRLSSLRGKIILLDFWASQHQECLYENRELLEIYSKYKNKGFNIYQVSLDTDRELWVAAINKTGLPWINVCDLSQPISAAAKSYNVTSIPMNYLIDREYNIVGKNLFGKDLEAKLKEIL